LIVKRQPGADTEGDASSPPDLNRCWHETWFHWKSSPKIFLYCTLLSGYRC